jgi:diadenosine tetraphosphate (Ap4A) HIT family hydrolase
MKINERILADTVLITDLDLCQVRMMRDELDWLMLIPKREDKTEIHHLNKLDQMKLMEEISFCSNILEENGCLDNLNIGAIGNIVSQLHIHIIGRRHDDRAWPNTIWGTKTTEPFDEARVVKWKSYFKKS